MQFVGGKPVPMTMEEVLDPAHSAFVVIDVQNDFCKRDGVFPRAGIVIPSVERTIRNIAAALKVARRAGVKVVYVQHTTLPNRQGETASLARFMLKAFNVRNLDEIPEFCLEGTWGHRVVDELKPRSGDLIVKKHRSSAFIATDLDFILRTNEIRTLVATGVTTEGCVESTARDGQLYDYLLVTLRDCVDSDNRRNHEAMLEIMDGRWDVISSKRLRDIWKSNGRKVGA
jgi:nicotinamidase-related amidase